MQRLRGEGDAEPEELCAAGTSLSGEPGPAFQAGVCGAGHVAEPSRDGRRAEPGAGGEEALLTWTF